MYPDDVRTNKWYGHCYHATLLFYALDTELLVPMSAEDYREEALSDYRILRMEECMTVLKVNVLFCK